MGVNHYLIRTLVFFSCLLVFAAVHSQTGVSLQEEDLQFQNLFDPDVKQGVACYRIPALVTAADGSLIIAIDERNETCGDLRYNKDINIVVRRSSDNGLSWSEIENIVDYPYGISASDPSMVMDRETGDIFLFYNYMDLEKENGIYYQHMIRSKDNGKTWSAAVDITPQITRPEWQEAFKIITSGGGTQTRSGQLLHIIFLVGQGACVFGSDDHGQSWHLFGEMFHPADESKIVELDDGSWMVNSRVNGAGLRYVHISHDEGKTWTTRPDSSLIDPGCNAALINYNAAGSNRVEGLLLFTNASSIDKRENMTLKISNDNGLSWTGDVLIYPGSAAYSSMSILENGDIGLVFEKDDYRENVFVRIPRGKILPHRDHSSLPHE